MNEVVEHSNNMNTVALRKFTPVELDLFMTLCHKMKRKSVDVITFSFSDLKKLCGFTSTDISDFVMALDNTYNKLIQTNIKIGNDEKWTRFVLFTKYTIDTLNQEITIGVNKEFQYVLNDLSSQFTRFELQEFIDLKSSYAKECYRRLKQFRTQGWWEVPIDEFRRVLDVPDTYRMCDIDRWVLKPIEKELKAVFNDFNIIKKYKNGRGRGGKVVSALRFDFEKETVEKSSYTEHQSENKDGSKAKIEPRKTDFICEKCGKPLYEMILKGNNCWCHNFKVQGDECKQIYNSVAEVKGYDEEPQNQTYDTSSDDVDHEYNKQKIKEMLDSLGN